MRLARGLALVAAMAGGAAAQAGGARPVSATGLLTAAGQLVVVTTADWNAVRGDLRTYERGRDGGWVDARPRAAAVPIVVGKNGTAWDPGLVPPVAGPLKAEGDGRSPAGVFALARAFGFAPAGEAGWLKLPYVEVTPTLECVDDPASGDYNQLVDAAAVKPDWGSSEKMRQIDPAYRWGVVVEYNTSPVVPRRGSCVFLHIGGDRGAGTAGCTAMTEPALKAVMQWLDPARAPVLVQMPVDAYAALRAAWGLPALAAAR
ncbi:MAG: L,D-transpeptidase family protein [Vicinamibacterales bacterium]